MNVVITQPKPLNYNPYDECVCGSHDGEKLTITCDNGEVIITVQETKSGIGSSYCVTAKYKDQESKPYWVYADDDGVLQAYVEADA